MPTYTEQLTTLRDQIISNLVDLTENPKPSYTIGDETYLWEELQDLYMRQLERLNLLIAQSEPYEIRTRRLVR